MDETEINPVEQPEMEVQTEEYVEPSAEEIAAMYARARIRAAEILRKAGLAV